MRGSSTNVWKHNWHHQSVFLIVAPSHYKTKPSLSHMHVNWHFIHCTSPHSTECLFTQYHQCLSEAHSSYNWGNQTLPHGKSSLIPPNPISLLPISYKRIIMTRPCSLQHTKLIRSNGNVSLSHPIKRSHPSAVFIPQAKVAGQAKVADQAKAKFFNNIQDTLTKNVLWSKFIFYQPRSRTHRQKNSFLHWEDATSSIGD